MNNDPVQIYLILFTLSSLILFIVGLLIAYLSLFNKYTKTIKTSVINEDIKTLFKDTEARLKSIVDTASAQAAQTMSSTQFSTEKQLKIFEEEVNKSTAVYLSLYQKTLDGLERETAKEIKAIPQELRRDLGNSLSGIAALFKDDVVKISSEVKDSLNKAYKNIEIDIEEYKKLRLNQVDKSIADIILQIARRVLVKEINKDEHEKLVLKALEDAKKSGMFSEDV